MKRLYKIMAIASILTLGAVDASAVVRNTQTQQLAKKMDREEPFCNSVWGFVAVNMQGDTLAKINSNRRMVPASNMKLITTGAALVTFGPSYTFKTSIAYAGEVKDSTLFGDLYIIGGGDPMLGDLFSYLPSPSEAFAKWRKILKDNGIYRIEGNIVGDGSYFNGEAYHTDWSMEDGRTKDGVVPQGLTYRGKMKAVLPDGPLAAATHFRNYLVKDTSFVVTGVAAEGKLPTPSQNDTLMTVKTLGVVASQPLKTLIKTANYQSDNFTAETLIRALGKQLKGSADYSSATSALHKALSPLNLANASMQQRFADGSGLSRKNYISPNFMVSFLKAMAKSKYYKDYLASIPKPGSGTLKNRLAKQPQSVKDRVYMKSGSLNGTRAFSGYILSGDGNPAKTICFSVITNNSVASYSQTAGPIDELISQLAKENE